MTKSSLGARCRRVIIRSKLVFIPGNPISAFVVISTVFTTILNTITRKRTLTETRERKYI